MNKKERDLFRLGHICDCIDKVEYLAEKLQDFDSFEKQWVEKDAIIRNLEIIGEASVNISEDLKAQYPDVDWHAVRGMRNFVVHEYYGISSSIIWDIVVTDIPVLKKQIANIIDDLTRQAPQT